jgi:hypothetical protein
MQRPPVPHLAAHPLHRYTAHTPSSYGDELGPSRRLLRNASSRRLQGAASAQGGDTRKEPQRGEGLGVGAAKMGADHLTAYCIASLTGLGAELLPLATVAAARASAEHVVKGAGVRQRLFLCVVASFV